VIAFALGVAALSGCTTSSYQRELFAFDAWQASYPVMLSSVPRPGAGEPFVAHAEMRSSTVSAKTSRDTITTWSSAETSDRNVSDDLTHQVPRGTRWVQIDRVVYTGDDLFQAAAACPAPFPTTAACPAASRSLRSRSRSAGGASGDRGDPP
jgi:hypothetical protein